MENKLSFENMQLVLAQKSFEIETNMNALECFIVEAVEYYKNMVITPDNAKGLRKELNAGRKAIEAEFNARYKEIEAPLIEVKKRFKDIMQKCDEAKIMLDNKIIEFEAGMRAKAVELCTAYKNELCLKNSIDPEAIDTSALNNLTFVTESGKLASAGKAKVEALVNEKLMEIKSRELEEAQKALERENLKNQLREEIAQEEAQIPSMQQFTHEAPVQEQIQEAPKPEGENAVYTITAVFKASAKRGYADKVMQYFQNLIMQNEELKKSLGDIYVRD